MCGISGIVSFDPSTTVDEGRLLTMRDSLIHRGPDGAGIMCRGPVGLAHRRLSIIDVGGGHQPMANPTRDMWITYNGELYNFRALRKELSARGCTFATQSDTEVVLRAYEIFGPECVVRLEGMFAFAVWDSQKQTLFLARDRLGIKPLYYSLSDSELVFASEIKAILAGSSSQPALNRAILPEYFASRYIAGEGTFFEGINKLRPARTLTWSLATGAVEHQYWHPPSVNATGHLRYEDYQHEVRKGLEEAVESHLVSDVPVGLFLSGGIDSTILAGLMAPRVSGPIKTFSIGFEDASANELAYARLAAEAVEAEHREITLSAEQFFAELPSLLWHEDEPIAFTSSIPLHIVSRLASNHVKVVLTGEGADELFLGYGHRYRTTIWNCRLGKFYKGITPAALREAIAGKVETLPRALRRYAERSFLALDCSAKGLFFDNFSVYRPEHRSLLFSDSCMEHARDIFSPHLAHYRAAGDDVLASMSRADVQTYLVELLMKQDQMSMAASLESRVPFLDHRLVEKVLAIPGRYRLRGGKTKALLRDAVRDIVPQEIMNRRKMGFPVPIRAWLRDRYRWIVEDLVLGERALSRDQFNADYVKALAYRHFNGSEDNAERLWMLINLEIWQRIFIDGEPVESIYSQRSPAASPQSASTSQWVSV
ncbi:asparagine synthase (glutamine-hydrolyzing) [Litorivivens lipolytica]|uniref:asparagine synthase (glutamine-hydrolyzing) n=1 Tax=Litorivivens lipolytica TaxID=1524264 RepID=A0A7W4W680_9GAMM|nr:asparagine synthase (glutamine-hydrolyzing) [Litorivivens lipolytica]MBB3047833.1 asparagine synthase (glutamine-hydrolyzing) [Litorivivens lipolytica]